jgi:hypothetical protein
MSYHIITHPTLGVFIGTFLGFGMWSKLDPVGQDSAATFTSAEEAQSYAETWSSPILGLEYLPVVVDRKDGRASIAACVAAGAEGWLFEEMDTVGGVQ